MIVFVIDKLALKSLHTLKRLGLVVYKLVL